MSSSTPMPPSSTTISEQMRAELSSQALLANDHTTQHLGMTVERVAPGFSRLRMKVSEDMLNGHASCHGGYLFTLADSAFAFACNSFNQVAVAASAAIEFLAPAYLDDVLTAESSVQSQGSRTGLYDVVITNQRDERVALFRGRSHRLGRTLFDEEDGANER